jgi:hypothetical protein
MRRHLGLICLLLLLVVPTARGDIPPPVDVGPRAGSAGGLNFAIHSVGVMMPRGFERHFDVVVLVGCIEGKPNCVLAQSRNLIGMEVNSVDNQELQPRLGQVQQVIDAFTRKADATTITLELYSRETNQQPIRVIFTRQ